MSRRRRRETILVSWKAAPPSLRDEPREDEQSMHEDLLNWGMWCKRSRRAGRCASAEGGYIPERVRQEKVREARVQVNSLSAERINSGMLLIPKEERHALQLRYYLSLPDRIIARKLGVNIEAYPACMRRARLMLRNVLRYGEKDCILRPDNSTLPSSDETKDAQKQGVLSSSGNLLPT